MPFTDHCKNLPPSIDGKKITQRVAHNMVYESYWQRIIIKHLTELDPVKKDKILDEVVAVRYRRCLFDSILSDPNCVGIRFYFTETTKDDLTLVIVGYDKNGKDLTVTNKSNSIIMESSHDNKPENSQTFIAEIGGGDKFRAFYDPQNPIPPPLSGRVLITNSDIITSSEPTIKIENSENSDDPFHIGMSELFYSIAKEKSSELDL